MTLAQQRTFLGDMQYVLTQATAFRDYRVQGHEKSFYGHPFRKTIHNALLESSLSFLRKINGFFGKESQASVRAFFPDYPLEWLWDRDACDLLNERVMHLSLCEAEEGKYDWTDFYRTHLPEAERRFSLFLERLKQEKPELINRMGRIHGRRG